MGVVHLDIRQVRNIAALAFTPCKQFNIIVGPNGSGKTSLLEAIHLLGLGRSFRTTQIRKLITHGSQQALVFGKISAGTRLVGVGVQKNLSGETLIKVDGSVVDSAASLADLLPLQLITPNLHELIEGEPQLRRSFLDWGLFHVEQSYLEMWRRWRRLSQQRNAALREGYSPKDIAYWDIDLGQIGERIAEARLNYLDRIRGYFEDIFQRLLGVRVPELTFRRGWPKELSLIDALSRNIDTDRKMGFTVSGPHRADVRLQIEGFDAADFLSRGEKKLAVCAMKLAQLVDLHRSRGKSCTLLIDDLPAELDKPHRLALMNEISMTGAQCFVTAPDSELIDTSPWEEGEVATFHVEHGVLRDVV